MNLTHSYQPGGVAVVALTDNAGNPVPMDEVQVTAGDGGAVVALTTNPDTSSISVEGVGPGSATITVNTAGAVFNGAQSGTFTATATQAGTEWSVTVASGSLPIL